MIRSKVFPLALVLVLSLAGLALAGSLTWDRSEFGMGASAPG